MPRVARPAMAELLPQGRAARDMPKLTDRPGWLKLRLRRMRRALRPSVLASAMVLLFAAGLVITQGNAWRAQLGRAAGSVGFTIASIDIDGNAKTARAAIIAQLGADKGSPILGLSLDAARMRIATLPWVREARIERILPDRIRISVSERNPVALWKVKGNVSLIDRSGDNVTDSDWRAFYGTLPLVVGEGADKAAVALLDLLATQSDLQTRMLAAIRVGGRRWNLCLKSGTEILLPEGAEAVALIRLAELQASQHLLERPLREIDLRLPDQLRTRNLTDAGCGQTPEQGPPTPSRKAT